MDVARPYTAVTPTVHGDVLVVLAGTTRPMTGRDVARLVRRGTQPAVQASLDRLVEHGLVSREQAGRAKLHTLNRDHIAAPVVVQLANLRNELLDRLRNLLGGWSPAVVHASMFGSAARGDGDIGSDIDVFVVRHEAIDEDDPSWRTQVDLLNQRVRAWTGNHASVVEVSEEDLDRLRREEPPVVKELQADGIDLAGIRLRDMFGPARA